MSIFDDENKTQNWPQKDEGNNEWNQLTLKWNRRMEMELNELRLVPFYNHFLNWFAFLLNEISSIIFLFNLHGVASLRNLYQVLFYLHLKSRCIHTHTHTPFCLNDCGCWTDENILPYSIYIEFKRNINYLDWLMIMINLVVIMNWWTMINHTVAYCNEILEI